MRQRKDDPRREAAHELVYALELALDLIERDRRARSTSEGFLARKVCEHGQKIITQAKAAGLLK